MISRLVDVVGVLLILGGAALTAALPLTIILVLAVGAPGAAWWVWR